MHGAHRAVVVEVGAGLREYTVDGVAVLDGYPPEEMCSGGRGQTLIPWPNRISGGKYEFDGSAQRLPLDRARARQRDPRPDPVGELDGRLPVRRRRGARVPAAPAAGLPVRAGLPLEYTLSDRGLAVHTTVTNAGDRPARRDGAHQLYLTVGTDTVDGATLTVPGDRYLPVDNKTASQTGTEDVEEEGSPYDYRGGRSLDVGVRVDHCFTDLERDSDGVATVRPGRGADRDYGCRDLRLDGGLPVPAGVHR